MTVVIDAAALLALLLDEPGAPTVLDALDDAVMSAVNWAELVAKLSVNRSATQIEAGLAGLKPRIVPADEQLALASGLLRPATRSAGLSLGDRFCLALARRMNLPALTSDRKWADIADAVGVDVRLIR